MEYMQHGYLLFIVNINRNMSMPFAATLNPDIAKIGSCTYRFALPIILAESVDMPSQEVDVTLGVGSTVAFCVPVIYFVQLSKSIVIVDDW
jgi:hypothetical protein